MVITSLINELNVKLEAGLSDAINYERREITPQTVDYQQVDHLILVGTTHAEKLYERAKKIGTPATFISTSPQNNNVTRTAKQLGDIVRNLERRAANILVVYQLFDNLTYTDSIGRTATRGTHIRGAVHIAKSSTISQAVEEALPLLEAAGGQAKAILAPFPRYITGPCCNDPSHTTNVLLNTYQEGLKKDLGEVAKFIRDVLNNNGIRRPEHGDNPAGGPS